MLFGLAGFQLELRGERSFKPTLRNHKDIHLVVARAEEIPTMVENGLADIGLTGIDWVEETGVSITDLTDLGYNEHGRGSVNWVLAVPKEKKRYYKNLQSFAGKKVTTELVNITRKYFFLSFIYNDSLHKNAEWRIYGEWKKT